MLCTNELHSPQYALPLLGHLSTAQAEALLPLFLGSPPAEQKAALVALMARWYHLDVKYDVSPPPCRPGDVTADCTYDLIFVSRRFARDLRARNVSLTPAGARALWKRTYGPPAGRGEEPPGWRRA